MAYVSGNANEKSERTISRQHKQCYYEKMGPQ